MDKRRTHRIYRLIYCISILALIIGLFIFFANVLRLANGRLDAIFYGALGAVIVWASSGMASAVDHRL